MAFVDAPDRTAAAGVGDVPPKTGLRLHLSGGEAATACARSLTRGFGIPVAAGYRTAQMISHQTPDKATSAHTAGGVTVADGGTVVEAHQAADSGACRGCAAGGIAVTDRCGTPVCSNQPAGAAAAVHIACGVTAADGAAVFAEPHQTTDAVGAGHVTCRVAVTDGAAEFVGSHKPAHMVPCAGTAYIPGSAAVADGARVVQAHQSANRVVAAHAAGGVAVANGAAVVKSDQTAHLVLAGHTAANQPDIPDHGTRSGVADQAHIDFRRTVDRQTGETMSQAIKNTREIGARTSHRCKACTGIPLTGRTGIDIAAQHIISRKIAAHALQVGSCRTPCSTQAGDHCVILDHPVRTKPGAEVVSSRKIDRRIDLVAAGVPRRHCLLPEVQRKLGTVRAIQVGVDVDVVLGVEGELACAPAEGGSNVEIVGQAPGTSYGAACIADVVALLGAAKPAQYRRLAALRTGTAKSQFRRSVDEVAGDRAGNICRVIADVGQRLCTAIVERSQGDRCEKAAQQRRGAVLVDAPDGGATAGVGEAPAGEVGRLLHLRSGKTRTATCRRPLT